MTMPVTLFRRKCRVVVDTIEVVALETREGDSVDPSSALTVRFKVDKNLTPTPNKAEIHILNLTREHQAQLAERADVPVLIEAGYEDATSVIFLGKLRTARPTRDGADVIMSLSSSDGGTEYQKGRVSLSVKKGTSTDVVIKELVRALGVLEGNLNQAIATINANALGQMFAAGTCVHGQASVAMTDLCRSAGLIWSIQDGKLQILPLRQALAGEAILLSSEANGGRNTGLVEAPSVDPKGILKAKMLIAPDVIPGRIVVVQSEFVNGQYRIEKTTHTGDTRGTDWYVEIEGRRY